MAFEIVDGMTGTKHISSDDLSALNVATIGKANCVLKYGDDFKLTMASANSATLGRGVGMVGGKRFWNQAATSLTVQSGTQGQKRNDLVVARYAKTSAGIESITPVVIKGTPSTGTAADPATTSNDLKLWRIPLNGISVGTPVKLFDTVPSLASLEESVSKLEYPKVICGSVVRDAKNFNAVMLFSDEQFKQIAGRAFNNSKDCILAINADGNASGVVVLGIIYDPRTKHLDAHLSGATGAIRLNYIITLGA
jgi:hypothetical protein